MRGEGKDEVLEPWAQVLDEVEEPGMEVVSCVSKEQEHVVEGGAPRLGGRSDHTQEGADLGGHDPKPGSDVIDEGGDAGDERPESVLELGAIEALHDLQEHPADRGGHLFDGVAQHRPQGSHRLPEHGPERAHLLEEAADLMERLHEGFAVLQGQRRIAKGPHRRLELGEPGPASGLKCVRDAGDDLHGGDGNRAQLAEGGHALANPALDTASVVTRPAVEVGHGLGEPGAKIGEDLGADADHAHDRTAERLPPLRSVLCAGDRVGQELLEIPEGLGGPEASRQGGHGVSPCRRPDGNPGGQDRDQRPMKLTDGARGARPDVARDNLAEALPVADDLGEDFLEVVDRSTDDQAGADRAEGDGRERQGQLAHFPDVGEEREHGAQRADGARRPGGDEREVLGDLGHHHVQAREPVDHVAEGAPQDANTRELPQPLGDVAAGSTGVPRNVAPLALEAPHARTLHASPDCHQAVPRELHQAGGDSLHRGLVQRHVQLDAIDPQALLGSIQLLLEVPAQILLEVDVGLDLEVGALVAAAHPVEHRDLLAGLGDLSSGPGFDLCPLRALLEGVAAHVGDLLDEAGLATDVLVAHLGAAGHLLAQGCQVSGQRLLALQGGLAPPGAELLLPLGHGDLRVVVGDLLAQALVGLLLVLEGPGVGLHQGVELPQLLLPSADRCSVHIDGEPHGVHPLGELVRVLDNLPEGVELTQGLLAVDGHIHVDAVLLGPDGAVQVAGRPLGVRLNGDRKGVTPELPREIANNLLGVDV